MAVVRNWLSKSFGSSNVRPNIRDYEPVATRRPFSWQDYEDWVAARQRIEYLRDMYEKRMKLLSAQSALAGETEAAALIKSSYEHWATYTEVSNHWLAVVAASDYDIDFDAPFWWEHKALLRQLPEAMRPPCAPKILAEEACTQMRADLEGAKDVETVGSPADHDSEAVEAAKDIHNQIGSMWAAYLHELPK